MDTLDLKVVVNDAENDCGFDDTGRKTGNICDLHGCQGKVAGVLF